MLLLFLDIFTSIPKDSVALIAISAILGAVFGSFIKFIFEQLIPQWQARKKTKLAIQKYSFPLWRSSNYLRRALDIQLFDKSNYKWNDSKDDYYRLKMLYFFGSFFGWCSIIGKENLSEYIEYTDSNRIKSDSLKKFTEYYNNVYKSISDPYYLKGIDNSEIDRSRIPALVLTCIGDLMIKQYKTEDQFTRIISFLEFSILHNNDSNFKKWFQYVENLFVDFNRDKTNLKWNRLVLFYFYLRAFESFLWQENRKSLLIKNIFIRPIIKILKRSTHEKKIGKRIFYVNAHSNVLNKLNNDQNLADLNYILRNE